MADYQFVWAVREGDILAGFPLDFLSMQVDKVVRAGTRLAPPCHGLLPNIQRL
jgi:hypothetical protein